MTKDNDAASPSKDNDVTSSSKDVTPQETPFQVVLVDLKKAAREGEIHCVEKTLMGDHDLKFVAVSYRWGELHETLLDTQLGYFASITSFDLNSFLILCRSMAMEKDLKDMDYVWIDAICVDQVNPIRRKATIYQMTNIYDRANYIVAVPDLHLQYLKDTNKKNEQIIKGSITYRKYIYHLIKGDTEQLAICDQTFLDTQKAPDDLHLRHLLQHYTNHFATGFMKCQHHDTHYDAKYALQHIFETNATSRAKTKHHHISKACRKVLHKMGYDKNVDPTTVGIAELHKCDKVDECPLDLFHDSKGSDDCGSGKHDEHTMDDIWKQRIPERSASIRQSMDFLADLVQDWSTRVWVISEYTIAKKKSNKMKYWFIQLSSQDFYGRAIPSEQGSFFELDFNYNGDDDAAASDGAGGAGGSIRDNGSSSSSLSSQITCVSALSNKTTHKSNAVYQTFHDTIQQQLNQQTFLEMILKSKASRNEDRFHAILPNSEYKDKLTSKEQVDEWHIHTLSSVKLQLYRWMSLKHKLELLFLSSNAVSVLREKNHMWQILPTFTSSKINWPARCSYPTLEDDHYKKTPQPCNFDLTNPSTLHLVPLNGSGGNGCGDDDKNAYKLHVIPKEYYTSRNYYDLNQKYIESNEAPLLRRLLKLAIPEKDALDLVCIPNFGKDAIEVYRDDHDWTPHYVFLVGCFVKNKWILKHRTMYGSILSNEDEWEHHYIKDHSLGFDIY